MLIIEIILIACTTLAAISIVLATLKTGIPPSPSSWKSCHVIVEATDNSGTGLIVDLGSGWGTLVIALAKKYRQRQVSGYELSYVPWLFTWIRKTLSGLDNLTLYRKDFLDADLSDASVLTCYLFPGGMLTLEDKLKEDNISDLLIVSSTFALPSTEPIKVIRVKDIYRTPIYLYRI